MPFSYLQIKTEPSLKRCFQKNLTEKSVLSKSNLFSVQSHNIKFNVTHFSTEQHLIIFGGSDFFLKCINNKQVDVMLYLLHSF